MAKYDDMSFGKAFAAARKEKGAGKTFSWKGNSYTTDRADDKKSSTGTKKTSTDSVIDRASKAIDRAEGERGYAMRPVARPKRDMSQEPTATKVETPKVTTTELPPARTAAETRGPAGSPRGPAKAMRTLSDITLADWAKMSNAERNKFGLPNNRADARAMLEGTSASRGTTGSAGRRDTRMAKGGMVKKSGYAKGGMVKANCGASMKPTQKGTKK
jgi:hypothetical protein